jgi:hypothetical protein
MATVVFCSWKYTQEGLVRWEATSQNENINVLITVVNLFTLLLVQVHNIEK